MSDKPDDVLHSEKHPDKPMQHKATQGDGSPQPEQAETAPSGLKPRDDTPAVLDKRSGPKNP